MIPSHLENHIDQRIRRIARGRRADTQELRDHIHEAAASAADGPVDVHHVDDAFASLGNDREIRDAFFPRPRHRLDRFDVILTALALLLVVVPAFTDDVDASCSVEGEGACEAAANGAAPELALLLLLPLLVAAALHWSPAWAAAIPAAAMGTWTAARLLVGEGLLDLLPLAAAVLMAALVVRHGVLERRLRA